MVRIATCFKVFQDLLNPQSLLIHEPGTICYLSRSQIIETGSAAMSLSLSPIAQS